MTSTANIYLSLLRQVSNGTLCYWGYNNNYNLFGKCRTATQTYVATENVKKLLNWSYRIQLSECLSGLTHIHTDTDTHT